MRQQLHAYGEPILGAASQIIPRSRWYKAAARLGVGAIEINRRHSKLHFNLYFLEKVRSYVQGLALSLHSATTGIIQERESFTLAELAVLRAEVDAALFLGAREIVFHLNAGALRPRERQQLAKIIADAKSSGVDLIYESDAGMRAQETLAVLGTYPDIGYALDLGHLNCAYGRNLLGCEIAEFISRVKSRVVYIHANNNCGTLDEHKGLNQGTLDWRGVMDLLDLGRVRKIIVEVRSKDDFLDTCATLADYLVDRAAPVCQRQLKQKLEYRSVRASDSTPAAAHLRLARQ